MTSLITATPVSAVSGDLLSVNAARVSFAKESTTLDASDEKLIKYLAQHKHWTPFAHPQFVFGFGLNVNHWLEFLEEAELSGFSWVVVNAYDTRREVHIRGSLYAWMKNMQHFKGPRGAVLSKLMKSAPVAVRELKDALGWGGTFNETGACEALIDHPKLATQTFRVSTPIFVRTQAYKHKIGFVENEVSRRYVSDIPDFYMPDEWCKAPTGNKKQGSSDETIKDITIAPMRGFFDINTLVNDHLMEAERLYENLIKGGVAPEQARMILPQSAMTEWFWTASYADYARMMTLRLKPDAQKEIQDLAKIIDVHLTTINPTLWNTAKERAGV